MVAGFGSPGDACSSMNGLHAPPTGDHQALHIHPAALAPTNVDMLFVKLMPIE